MGFCLLIQNLHILYMGFLELMPFVFIHCSTFDRYLITNVDVVPMFAPSHRQTLCSDAEWALQIVFGFPIIKYVGIFQNHSAELDCPWTQPHEYITKDGLPVNRTQKPLQFWNDLIKCMPNVSIVVDLFAGTGSAAFAAAQLGK